MVKSGYLFWKLEIASDKSKNKESWWPLQRANSAKDKGKQLDLVRGKHDGIVETEAI